MYRHYDKRFRRLGFEVLQITSVDCGHITNRIGANNNRREDELILVVGQAGDGFQHRPHCVNPARIFNREEHSFIAFIGTIVSRDKSGGRGEGGGGEGGGVGIHFGDDLADALRIHRPCKRVGDDRAI